MHVAEGSNRVGLRRRLTMVYKVKERPLNELYSAILKGMYSLKRRRDQVETSLPGGISRVVERVFKVQIVDGGVGKPLNRKVLRSIQSMVKGGGMDSLCFDVVVKYRYEGEARRGFTWPDRYKVCFTVKPLGLTVSVSHVKGLMRTDLRALLRMILDLVTLALRRRPPRHFGGA